jgi:hypothetical protein
MARTLARELNCDKKIEKLYERGLFDPQHVQIPVEEERTLAKIAYINIQGRGFEFDMNNVLFFRET